YLEKLSNLKEFLMKNIQFSNSDVPSNYSFMNQVPAQLFMVQSMERQTFFNLLQLTTRCLEVLNLWKLLNDHNFAQITSNIPQDCQTQLKNLSFRDIVVSGMDRCGLLASAL